MADFMQAPPKTSPHRFFIPAKSRGLVTITVIFILALLLVNAVSPVSMTYYDVKSLANSGAPLALAAIGQTIILLCGGFDLSAGATISLVNVTVASVPQETLAGQFGAVLAGLLVGGLVGAFNGFFVAYFRLQSIVVTLSTMFLVHGITLLIMPNPGGFVAPGITAFFATNAIPGFLPSSVVVLLIAIVVWLLIKGSRFGTAIYAVGSDEDAAGSAGLSVPWTRFWAFTCGGLFYGAAGVFISAQTGSADPLVGDPILLQTFAAVVLGGTALGGGRGGALGSVFGAYTLMVMVNILLSLDISAYYSTVAEGVILIVAALAGAMGSEGALRQYLGILGLRLTAMRTGTAPSASLGPARTPVMAEPPDGGWKVSWLTRHADLIRLILPSYVAFVVIVIVTQLVYGGHTIFGWQYYNSLIVLSSFLLILALGQGTVILSGGLDLSIPWTIAFCGILAAGLISGSDLTSVWVIPLVLIVGILIGMLNGIGVAILGLPPIVMTLAMNGILHGAALVFSNGTPSGFTSPSLRWLMTSKLFGITPVVFLDILFILAAIGLLGRTVFSRWVYALGNSPRASYLAGINVRATTISAYALSGLCSALVGILLTGFGGQASLGMGDSYLLPSIAVVVIGGTMITGGRGHYVGMIGGVLLLTALQMLLAGTTLPFASRDIIFGIVVLGAVLALKEKSTG